jgi:hypothetical protein
LWPKQKEKTCGSNLLLLTGHPSDSPRLNTFDSTAEKNEFLLSSVFPPLQKDLSFGKAAGGPPHPQLGSRSQSSSEKKVPHVWTM